ncbi:hypothetical protein L6452_08481 [Arctium lappa]|uniref:Uncharacterized protein n=1 Tax=Arctium lappa TaxID=4217 RepID=A0ACB9DHM2_ARCLA|nr:hypothetical protein L6452_08481 [Arctium lappa]
MAGFSMGRDIFIILAYFHLTTGFSAYGNAVFAIRSNGDEWFHKLGGSVIIKFKFLTLVSLLADIHIF